jgi:hypothetical protein
VYHGLYGQSNLDKVRTSSPLQPTSHLFCRLLTNTDFLYATSYVKGGRVGAYTSAMTIIPDMDLGWTVMGSAPPPELPDGLTGQLSTILGRQMLTLWLEVAREQANATYGGRYVAATPGLNSSLTIRADDDKPGIGVFGWVSNGTAMDPWTVAFGWPTNEDELKNMVPSTRLYPTGLEEELPDGGRRVSFRAVFEDLSDDPVLNSYVPTCNTWVRTIGIYGSKPLDLFVFTFDKGGKVTSVENMAMRARMDKAF